ncbi:hypothetical protein ABVK25_011237 [Lepraria finkii]|uniref:Uncharacterized protein n=1 Tax=Lepraria finkii TaxID=1340010 RepID=A0ABR4AQR7_9LECA
MAAQTSVDGVKEKTKFVKGYIFVAKYWDKRVTAEYAMKNLDSVLAQVPKEKFNSGYADPINPASSGSLISFVSGGRLISGPSSLGLVGGIASVVGQAVRGEK